MKKLKILTIVLIAAFSVAFSGLFSADTYADDVPISAITVSPMYQRVILTPGETTMMSVKISSPANAQNDLNYSVKIGSFSQSGRNQEEDAVDTDTVSSYNQIMDWIKLEKITGTVAPNDTDVLNFTVTVPESAPAGGQYATILIKDETGSSSGGGNVNIQSNVQMASIIYAEVAGETLNTAEILENNIPSFLMTSNLETTSLVKNTGNVHTDASYTLQVWPLFSDEEICTNEENSDTNLIMPGMERYFVQKCSLPLAGIFRVKQVVKIFDEVSTLEKMIVICPLWLIFIVVLAIVALIVWIVIRIKMRKKAEA
ncbi:hypothetical protein IJI79_02995 [Candidatus Saccharibacteria bacterium]|nr:hypothetical protein [Candidatus Saccharibacteria bacterium]